MQFREHSKALLFIIFISRISLIIHEYTITCEKSRSIQDLEDFLSARVLNGNADAHLKWYKELATYSLGGPKEDFASIYVEASFVLS